MVRKTKEEALVTRGQLLDAAERVFRERGVGHTTLAEVADAAGVTRGAIYHHFRSKADLFQEMVRRVEMPMDAALEELGAAGDEDPLGTARTLAIRALTQLSASEQTRRVFEIVFLRCEYTEDLADVQAQHLREREVCSDRCEMAFRRAVEKGQLPADTDVRLAAQGLYAFVGGVMRDWVQSPQSYDLPTAAPALIDVYLSGLKANPPRLATRGAATKSAGSKKAARPKSRAGTSAVEG
jgi:TetR/AcrR family acrAB operon transcriptional repressor